MAEKGPMRRFLGFADRANEDVYVTQLIHWVGNRALDS